jgi:hypothetical protein
VIAAGLRDVLSAHRPDVVAVERVFAQQNRATVMGTAQASGVALLLAAEHGLPAATHAPSGEGRDHRVRLRPTSSRCRRWSLGCCASTPCRSPRMPQMRSRSPCARVAARRADDGRDECGGEAARRAASMGAGGEGGRTAVSGAQRSLARRVSLEQTSEDASRVVP